MKNFWIKIKNWFINVRLWIKLRYYRIRAKRLANSMSKNSLETTAPKKKLPSTLSYVGSLLLIGLALLGTILYVRSRDDKDKNRENPEIAQIYEPSIGTPLAPDTPGITGGISDEATSSQTTPPEVAPTSGVDSSQPYLAPNTGVDPNSPVEYSNATMKFAAVLPVGANVIEKDGSVTFLSEKNSRYYTVSISPQSGETLSTIEAQLKNSTSVESIQSTAFNGTAALQFTGSDFDGSGVVFIKNSQVYYLLGNSQHFSSFQTI